MPLILLFNPDNLPFGERIRAGAKILATGASVVAGTMISELIAKTAIGTIPVVGSIVQTFCGTLVTGIMSCSLLYMLDNNRALNRIVRFLNNVPTVENIVIYYREQAKLLEQYSAELFDIDLDSFKNEVSEIHSALISLENCKTESDLYTALLCVYDKLQLKLPWNDSSNEDEFWCDKEGSWEFH